MSLGNFEVATIAVFVASVFLLAYGMIGYPLVLSILAKVRPRRHAVAPILPTVSVVISAHNEGAAIETKIRNLLEADYPPERLEILIGSDGSTDDTAQRLLEAASDRVRVLIRHDRGGKPSMLNALVPRARGEIIVFADVRQRFEAQAIRMLVQSFVDPAVGAVGGELILTRNVSGTNVGDGVGAYWHYEKFIRARESTVDSMVSATGAIYAMRRDLFTPIPDDTIIDDVLIPLRVVRSGYRVVFEPRARAIDVVAETIGQELTRKARTLAGNFQLFLRERWVVMPWRSRIWWQTASHKGLRLLFPPLQAAALLTNLVLINVSTWFLVTLACQTAFYAGAATGYLMRRSPVKIRIATFPFTFCLLSWATVLGLTRYLSGSQTVAWKKAHAD